MPTRRELLGGGLACLVGLGACDARPRKDSSRSTAHGSQPQRLVRSRLGGIVLSAASDSAMEPWSAVLPSAAALVAEVWGGSKPGHKLSVRICADEAEFLAQADGLDAGTAAVTTTAGIFVGPAASQRLTEEGKVQVLAHELTHAVLGHVGRDQSPLWLREGLADWTAQRRLTMRRSTLWPHLAGSTRLPTGPPTESAFTQDPALAYETSAAYVAYLVRSGGARDARVLAGARSDAAARASAGRLAHTSGKTFIVWLRSTLGR